VPFDTHELSGRLLASYACEAVSITWTGRTCLQARYRRYRVRPSAFAVSGFLDERPIHSAEIEAVTIALLASVLGRLGTKSGRASNTPARRIGKRGPAGGGARHHTQVPRQPASNPGIASDRRRGGLQWRPAASSKDEVIVAYPFIEAIAVQRLAHELYLDNVPLIPRIMTEWAHAATGLDLHPGAQIARISSWITHRDRGGRDGHHRQPRQDYQGVGLVQVARRRADAARPETHPP